ncbi:hypothetical protein FB446DRAFT_790514 [Lentinula raphanica]|nr:hypothetical protein FB446DRAFT_790514 [Lentinula raphanica]KAJ3818023.1 hypothetical protein F5880DRAFT_1617744 [Lentinula raphanica]
MFRLPGPLKHLIRSGMQPVDVDPEQPIPDTHLTFLRELKDFLSSVDEPLDKVEFITAIASQWSFLWPWMKTSLAAITTFETHKMCSPDMCRTVSTCTDPVLALIALILKSSTTKTASFITIVFNSPSIVRLLSLSWAASLTGRTDSQYTHLVMGTMRPLFDDHSRAQYDYDNIIHALSLELQLCSQKMFQAESLASFCVSLITERFLESDQSFDCLRLYMLLHLFHFPACGAFSRLDKAEQCLSCLCQVWELLTPGDTHAVCPPSGSDDSEASCSHKLRLSCLERILSYLVIFLSGGVPWVVVALNREHRVITRIAQSCRSLYEGCSVLDPEEAVSSLDIDVLKAFRAVIVIIHSHRAYRGVDYRIKNSFRLWVGSNRCTDSLLLPECSEKHDLQSSWTLLLDDFCAPQHISERRLWWSSALKGYCNYPKEESSVLINDRIQRLGHAYVLGAGSLCTAPHIVSESITRFIDTIVLIGRESEKLKIPSWTTLCLKRNLGTETVAVVVDIWTPNITIDVVRLRDIQEEMGLTLRQQIEQEKPRLFCCGRVLVSTANRLLIRVAMPVMMQTKLASQPI